MIISICSENGESILKACQRENIFFDSVCGGNGTCGKCKVRMLTNAVLPTAADQAFFSGEELEDGWRLSCMAKPQGICEIEIPENDHMDMSVVTDSLPVDMTREDEFLRTKERTLENRTGDRFFLVIDVGTTTVAIQLVKDPKENNHDIEVVETYTAVNLQRTYGADVISRIQASNQGKGKELKDCILRTLAKGMETLLKSTKVEQILIAGNTTMVHLLMGYSCETLGVAPFKPVTTDGLHVDAGSLFSSHLSEETLAYVKNAATYIFPGISAFVGGDIVAGLYQMDFHRKQEIQLLIDLGTNGEMVIGNRMRMLSASTAAGPAFEGGGLSCGCAGIKGAICGAKLLKDGTWELQTIGDTEPTGICGSGIVEVLYELYINGWIDETGLLAEGNLEKVDLIGETVYITQQDIRQFQMAKAAVRAGVETLIKEYGVELKEIARVYIAGGFGYYLNLEKATTIGLFPDGFLGKMMPVGNSCLAGLKRFGVYHDEGKLMNIGKYTASCDLAQNSWFQEKYLEYMYFSKFPNSIK